MQLQPPVRREPYRPPPREPLEGPADESEPAPAAAEAAATQETDSVAAVVAEPIVEPPLDIAAPAIVVEAEVVAAEILAVTGVPPGTPTLPQPASAPLSETGKADEQFGAGVDESAPAT